MAEMGSPLQGGIEAARDSVAASAPAVDTSLYERVQATERGLVTLSSSLSNISQQMVQFSSSLERISANINAETGLERQKERQEQQQEFLLAQQQIREGKESAIEQKIQSSLSAPVQKISQKTENTLGRLRQILTGVLFGWLGVSTVGLIRRYSDDVTQKFASVRDTVLKGLNTAGQFLSSIKTALTNVFSTISTISSRVAQHVTNGWFMEPIRNLVDAVKDSFKSFFNILPKNNPGTGGGPEAVPSGGTNAQSPPESSAETASSYSSGNVANLSLSESAMQAFSLPSLMGNSFFGANTQQPPEQIKTQSSTPMVADLQMNQQPVSTQDVHTEQQESQPAMYGEVGIKPLENVEGLDMSTSPIGTQTSPTYYAQVAPMQKQDVVDTIGKLEEPKPNVIIASAPSQEQQPTYNQTGKAPTFEIPSLPTSNPNNFYAMYSKTLYNVVI